MQREILPHVNCIVFFVKQRLGESKYDEVIVDRMIVIMVFTLNCMNVCNDDITVLVTISTS